MINREKFFAGVRNGPFPGTITPTQVAGMSAILDEWEKRKLTDLRWLAYMLATTIHETARTMQPINEYGKGKGRKYGVPDPKTGQTYYGRGFVQLTWLDNYRKMGTMLGVDLVTRPERALELPIASAIMFEGMIRGSFTGKKLADYFGPGKDDPFNARRIINGTDQAQKIAGYHKQFLADLQAAETATATTPVALPNPGAAPETPAEVKQVGGAAVGAGVLATAWQYVMGSGAIRVLLVLAIAFAVYWFLARPILRRFEALQGFYARVDEVEGGLLNRLRLSLKGIKTRLFSWVLALGGVGGGLLQYAEVIDFSKILPEFAGLSPSMYVPVILGVVVPWIQMKLRQATTTPEGQTDLALATPVGAPPLVPDEVAEPVAEEPIERVRKRVKAVKARVRKRARA